MPAAVVRGILISIGIIAALGIAVYENPEVQQWLDEQRRKLATLLRNIGDELDPQSRREAEAFAFGTEHQATTSTANDEPTADDAVTTARSPAGAGVVRRIPVQGPSDPQEREERQRLGREYLARRNQQMTEMQERRKTQARATSESFDSIVDEEGKLKIKSEDQTPLEDAMKSEFFDAPSAAEAPVNPFEDEHMIERSETPRPVVPPKIKLEHIDPMPEPEVIASSSRQPPETLIDEHRFPVPGSMPSEELSYEDQLALALAISKEESATPVRRVLDRYADDLRIATEASLRDAETRPHTDMPIASHLSDVSEEDLYNVTPNLTRATLATLDAQHPSLVPRVIPWEPIHEDAGFHSTHEARSNELVEEPSGTKTPTEVSSFAFESDEDTSAHGKSPVRSHTSSDVSAELIEVEDQASDVISEDGIATPDSWTEVGSHDGDSDVEMRAAA